jgi:hypothetical protein
MAGALRVFSYTSDATIGYGVRLDRTNARGTVTGTSEPLFAAVTPDNIGNNVPKGIKLRYANCVDVTNPKIKRRIYIGNLAAYFALSQATNPRIDIEQYPGNDDSVGTINTFAVQSLVGEKRLRINNAFILGSGLEN